MIERKADSIDVILRDENHPCFRKFGILLSLCQFPCIHHAAVVPSSARDRSLVRTLHFAVVNLPFAVFRQYVKAHAATVEIIRAPLCDDMFDNEIVPPEEDAQQKLHSFDIVVKAYVEKRVINQTESLNQRPIFRSNALLEHSHRTVPSSSSATVIIVCTAASIVKLKYREVNKRTERTASAKIRKPFFCSFYHEAPRGQAKGADRLARLL